MAAGSPSECSSQPQQHMGPPCNGAHACDVCVACCGGALGREFGTKVIQPKPIIAALPATFELKDLKARNKVKDIVVRAACRILPPPDAWCQYVRVAVPVCLLVLASQTHADSNCASMPAAD